MNDFHRLRIQIDQSPYDLLDDTKGFFLCYHFLGFYVSFKVSSITVLQNRSKSLRVNFDLVVVTEDIDMVQGLENLILSQGMFDVVRSDVVFPSLVYLVDFAGDVFQLLEVKGFVDLREASLSYKREGLVSVLE